MPAASSALNKIMSRVESMQSLDSPAGGVAAVISRLLPSGPVKDAASGTWLGHPLHPLLVSLPIGAWSWATVLDLATVKNSAARRLIGLGVLAAIPTAAAGGSDWVDTSGAERRVGLVHAIGAWVSIGLYASSWRARRPGGDGGKLLAMAGAATLGATGYLGGHLTYVYGVGVDTTAFQAGPQEWTEIGLGADVIEGSLSQFHVGEVALVVTRRDGRLYALADRCSHRGGPLSGGNIEGECVVCPWHASAFSVGDGSVRRGPASIPQPSYEVREHGESLQVRRTEDRSLRQNPV
ncbi:MAG TPA: Rieske 2Fe-2S domain-containing protein [Frankiaceae bacterium]|jgi:nitrite reductase/ring-hydroxylating ferredoxin subunit/uncharacterized membrane protein|nr:Rieske 2Fe-2S domain-containing protein [Frankiaceae bacterium]